MGDMRPAAKQAVKEGRAKNVSALVRQSLRSYLAEGAGPVVDSSNVVKTVDALRLDLARVGSNLNQLAHVFNVRGPVAFDRDALAETHQELRGEFAKIMGVLVELERDLRKPK